MPRVFTENLEIKVGVDVFSGSGSQNRVGMAVCLFSLEIGISPRNLWKRYPARYLRVETRGGRDCPTAGGEAEPHPGDVGPSWVPSCLLPRTGGGGEQFSSADLGLFVL